MTTSIIYPNLSLLPLTVLPATEPRRGKGLDSDGLIGLHRDHSYSQPMPQARFAHARTVNLGDSIFGYDLNRQGGEVRQYHLKDGEIIEFNCKHRHSLLTINSEIRFGINLWKLNPEKGFQPLF